MRIRLTLGLSFCAVPLALMGAANAAAAPNCPGNPGALGTSRTIVVDPREHGRIGTMSYVESLPLANGEVVLTFDDGPLPPYTNKILDILKAQCVRATYFIVGRMAREFPDLVRRAHGEGHTIGTHSMNHPIPFATHGYERTKAEIERGIEATAAALGDAKSLAPFFRFPGLGRTDPVEDYLGTRGLMIWSADFPADDWRRIGADAIVQRALRRLEAKGKGILLLHDIQPATVLALPTILAELKSRGYRIVHVQPVAEDRPKTVTIPRDWLPHDRPRIAIPLIALADVQNPRGDFLSDKSAAALCALASAPRKQRVRHARHQRRAATRRLASEPASIPDIHTEQY